MCIVAPGRRPQHRQATNISGYGSRIGARSARLSGTTEKSALDERLLDHEVTGHAVAALEKVARLEQLAQFFQHRRAATHHDAVGRDIERRQMEVVEQLL